MGEKTARILLISDTGGQGDLFADVLKQCRTPLDCHCVSSVRQALNLPDDMTFDLILLDSNGRDEWSPDIADRHPGTPLLLLAEPRNGRGALETLRRRTCDLLIKDPERFYLQVLPLKIQNLLTVRDARRRTSDGQPVPQRLSEYEELTKSLFEHSPNMIFINTKGRVIYANKMCMQVMGYERDDFYSQDFDFLSLIAPQSRQTVEAGFRRHMRGEDVDPYDYTLLTRDGRRIECIMSTKLIQYHGQQSILGIITDISHRKRAEEQLQKTRDELELRVKERTAELLEANESLRSEIAERGKAEEALRESEIQFKTIFENAGGAILIADTETGRILECNSKAETLTGRTYHDIVGRHQADFHPPDECDRYREIFTQHVRNGQAINFGMEIQHADGHRIPVWLSAQVMTIKGNKVIMGLFIDVTERKRAEEERARLMEAQEEKNAELESIINVASHDFRTPLVTITGFTGELEHSCRRLRTLLDGKNSDSQSMMRPVINEDIPEAVELIKASAAKLGSLLDGMQRLARLDYSDIQKDTLDMNAMIGDIIKTMGFQAKKVGARFNVAPLPDCVGDNLQINQVFSNLLGNALNYLAPGRAGLISVSGRLVDGKVVYCVEDNGIGIDNNNLADIFKIFYMIDPKKSQGSGLGLAIVRRIVNRHNGKAWAESKLGEGSRFFVSLPGS